MKVTRLHTLSAGLLAASMLPLLQTGCSEQAAPAPTAAATPAPAPVAPAPVPAAPAPAAPAPAPAAPPAAAAAATPGPSSIMVTNAWKALEAKDYDGVAKNAQQCIDLFKQQALDQQKALTAPPTEKADVFAQWALNDVGTAYFVLGQSLEKQNKNKEAVDTYQFLVDNLPFAQCWDPKGWFWKPAAAAKDRIKALQLDTLK